MAVLINGVQSSAPSGAAGGELGGTYPNPTVAATHSGTAHHTRSHTVTSTSDHTAGNWKVLYTNGSGQVIELALGAANTVLQSAGATSAPTFATPTTLAHGASSHDDRTRTMYFDWNQTVLSAGAASQAEWTLQANTHTTTPRFFMTHQAADNYDSTFALIRMPADMVAGTPNLRIVMVSGAAAGNYVLVLTALELADATGATSDAGSATTTGALSISATLLRPEFETITFPIATLAADDWCRVGVSRAPLNASDTLGSAVGILTGAALEYTGDM